MAQKQEVTEFQVKNVLIMLAWVLGAILVLSYILVAVPPELHDTVALALVGLFIAVCGVDAYRKRAVIIPLIKATPTVIAAIFVGLAQEAGKLLVGIVALAVLGGIIWGFFAFPLPIIAIALVLILLVLVAGR